MIDVLASFKRAALGVCLIASALPVHAGLFDGLFGKKTDTPPAQMDPAQRSWKLGEFTSVQIVPKEAGAADNQHPARIGAEVLRWQLGGVLTTVDGTSLTLFAPDEINLLAEPLAQAFAVAGPGEDVVLLSTSRRGASFLSNPTTVAARLFVQDGNLQLIVQDARRELSKEYISSRAAPTVTHGSRKTASTAKIANSDATVQRADWLALALTMPGGAAAPAVITQPAMAPAAAATTRTAPATGTALEPLQTEAEHRLATLKRLRDRGLISEDEFQEKRKEILKLL